METIYKDTKQRTLLHVLLHERQYKVNSGIYHKLQVDFAYQSNRIEGCRLSTDQTMYLFDTHSIEGYARVNDIFETVNHFRCFDHILDTVDEPITEDYIKNLHRIMKTGIIPEDPYTVIGEYKSYSNTVGDIKTASPEEVSAQMKELLKNTADKTALDIYDIAEFHAGFEKIHPFYDGNGRVGRLLIFKMCLAGNIVPFYIDEGNKSSYYTGLTEWQTQNNKTGLVDGFLSAQENMKNMLDYFRIEYNL